MAAMVMIWMPLAQTLYDRVGWTIIRQDGLLSFRNGRPSVCNVPLRAIDH